ncbi:uncharacterized protein METZ01_LOCUS345105 [marine metagenome]|uniref:Uncharacterized protein n=1 Tax=marine metagenome TaxID=408172 RepID=A0A382R6P5_9ZZZZ
MQAQTNKASLNSVWPMEPQLVKQSRCLSYRSAFLTLGFQNVFSADLEAELMRMFG